MQITKEIQVDIIEMEIMPDHVHLLIEVDLQFGIHKAVKRFKGRHLDISVPSSHTLNQEFLLRGLTVILYLQLGERLWK